MSKQISEVVLQKNSEILRDITSDLVPVIAADLNVGFHEADEIVRGTELYRVLSSECVLQDDYNLDGLKLILRKELVRAGEYPSRDAKITDFGDFVITMRHEVIYNCVAGKRSELSLAQVSLLVEGINNSIIDKADTQNVQDTSETFDRYVDFIIPDIIEKCNFEDDIWYKINVDLHTIIAYCKMKNKRPTQLTDDELSGFCPTI